jgi:hypothetical protein
MDQRYTELTATIDLYHGRLLIRFTLMLFDGAARAESDIVE